MSATASSADFKDRSGPAVCRRSIGSSTVAATLKEEALEEEALEETTSAEHWQSLLELLPKQSKIAGELLLLLPLLASSSNAATANSSSADMELTTSWNTGSSYKPEAFKDSTAQCSELLLLLLLLLSP
mmetsp:Transcript_61496/g.146689  ORF Transcript_61496/g.146689 Transcript_61496/m.146689 type:complete len:129 (+) Transcript_61496:610-996(+)